MESQYFKFKIPYSSIENIMLQNNYNQIYFYIDLMSIARGFYNVNVVELELSEYVNNLQENIEYLPYRFIHEAKDFYNKIFKYFQKYNPKFITFFDDGSCIQNKNLLNSYKNTSASKGIASYITEQWKINLMHDIKKYYLDIFLKHFNINNLSCCIDLDDYEADLVPHYILDKNLLNSRSNKILNVILSTDKDLLQTCKFPNVIQSISLYKKKESKIEFNIYDNQTGISYIYKNFKRGILDCNYIPLILAISGDKADEINGIQNIGPSKACKLIEMYRLPHKINKYTDFVDEKLNSHKNLILNNYKITCFEEQIHRIPYTKISYIDETIKII